MRKNFVKGAPDGPATAPPATGASPWSALLHALGVLALVAALLNVALAFRDARDVKLRVDATANLLERLQKLNDQRRRQIRALEQDPLAIRRELELRLGGQPGEEVVRPR